ncbi:MAG: Glyoxalase/bleomycin resistance protein/dioxygenase [Thermoleophilia bacterium]|jgi:hypothetical protein|nr:Glyoxalase/bleomycin resistance protein/dioxygenase [Thermoleophilia bacterium]
MPAAMPTVRRLDHIAVRVHDRVRAAAELVERFEVHVIERNDRLTLIGADFEHGKFTLLDADTTAAPAQGSRLGTIVVFERNAGSVGQVDHLESGLVVRRAGIDEIGTGAESLPQHALIGFELRSTRPADDAASLASVSAARGDAGARVDLGQVEAGGWIQLVGDPGTSTEVATLDHVGLLVDDVAAWQRQASESALDVTKFVEAANSRALFVSALDGVLLEFVEHLPESTLA